VLIAGSPSEHESGQDVTTVRSEFAFTCRGTFTFLLEHCDMRDENEDVGVEP
jgi:hypothetical protein